MAILWFRGIPEGHSIRAGGPIPIGMNKIQIIQGSLQHGGRTRHGRGQISGEPITAVTCGLEARWIGSRRLD